MRDAAASWPAAASLTPPADPWFSNLINTLTTVTGCLSMSGALLIIWTFWKSKRIRAKKLRQMLVVLSVFVSTHTQTEKGTVISAHRTFMSCTGVP